MWLVTPFRAVILYWKRFWIAARHASGPQWLADNVLQGRWVLAVAGTHGKTTTASMLAWILEDAGLSPGFLIGGVPMNFGVSARLSGGMKDSPFFVISRTSDTAFCDKRSKFIHYRPRTAVLNNLGIRSCGHIRRYCGD